MEEYWLPIPGYKGIYNISNLGNIECVKTTIGRSLGIKKAVLTNKNNKYYYPRVSLTKNRVTKIIAIHRLVALTFIPNPNNKPEVNHRDGNKSNYRLDNLEWVTPKENIQHSIKTGLAPNFKGSNNGRSKLTENQVINIRHCKGSVSAYKLAKLYGVSEVVIGYILKRKSWRHI